MAGKSRGGNRISYEDIARMSPSAQMQILQKLREQNVTVVPKQPKSHSKAVSGTHRRSSGGAGSIIVMVIFGIVLICGTLLVGGGHHGGSSSSHIGLIR